MEELLKNETVRMKIKSLSAPVRKSFIENLLDLYEQEAEEMIDVIEESRLELRGDFLSFEDDSKSMRAESRMLEDRRKDYEHGCVDEYMRKKGMASRNSASRLSYINEENQKSVKDYMKKRGKRRPMALDDMRSQSEERSLDSRVGSRLGNREGSVLSTRSLPTPVTSKTVEEEKDAVMKNLTSANQMNEVERRRQAELIAQRREKRRQEKKTTEEKALELLEKALAMDKKLADKKSEQEQKVKERLEDMKRKRAESRMGGREQTTLTLEIPEPSNKPDRREKDKDDRREKSRSSETSSENTEKSEKHRSKDKRDKKEKPKHDKKAETESSDKKKEPVSDYDFTIY